jgi:hypothetical protein
MATSDFIDPTFGAVQAKVPAARRPGSLAGKVVGLLDNTKEGADIILKALGDALVERYGAARVVMRKKEMFSKVATPEILNDMAGEVEVAIAALGG